ncbi:TPA: hypothetical protein ACKONR_003314 [Clostridioides difficile]|uniref:Putative glycosyl transferase n=3 Tax=Clostridioides difficile TaxID=1496 RepID=J7SBW1_CLODI|nr:glycosyl transferase 8 family protein [Clostridioides difficile]EQG74330.1 glycosyl transferase 8 family protein [Clostridioides difficile DA00165]AXU28889.1 Capsular polysaccharide biosynthesis protein [Clostridioides difficile]AXU32677.1 Capsular polysaccharide biosynthesis protein [Clostridioides difficile]AXU36465.1 Capsular polysaccharide biosynthesis protein [Clostridioides difficile]EAA0009151.1 hypothetical protein [Clostridioides difficile]
MHFFTSITTNYLPKARVLANSVKKNCENSWFILVVCDNLPNDFNLEKEPFDEVWTIESLGLPVENLNMWIFQHTVVELCTAVKGQAMLNLLNKYEKCVYLDPDMVVFDSLKELENLLDSHDIILTPHVTHKEEEEQHIRNNEIASLRYGAYNLGFLAVKRNENGLEFVTWWRDRLCKYCFDDIPGGLFTDQKWIDLAPGLFEGVYILRDPSYNVATWNITWRKISNLDGKYKVNNIDLKIYHFSGFDSGAQEIMLKVNGGNNQALWNLREQYILEQEKNGQKELGSLKGKFDTFDNGEIISKDMRVLMRNRLDLQDYFKEKNPFCSVGEKSYYNWYKNNVSFRLDDETLDEKSKKILELENELNRLRKMISPLQQIKKILKKFLKR